jgi:hypothetical protein
MESDNQRDNYYVIYFKESRSSGIIRERERKPKEL